MLMCQLAVQKSVLLLREAEGIDGLWWELAKFGRSRWQCSSCVIFVRSLQSSCWQPQRLFCSLCLRLSLSFSATLPLQSTAKVLRMACCIHSWRLPSWMQTARGRMLRCATASLLFVFFRCNCARWIWGIQACTETWCCVTSIHVYFFTSVEHKFTFSYLLSAICPCINHFTSIRHPWIHVSRCPCNLVCDTFDETSSNSSD